MAMSRRVRFGGPVVAAALVAIAILPPRVPGGDNIRFAFMWGSGYVASSFNDGRSQFATDVNTARRIQAWRLRRAIFADSIAAVARSPRALRSKDGLITLVYERPLTADSARFWLSAATNELALYPQEREPGMPLVVALLSDPVRDRPQNPASYTWGVEDLVEQAASAGACVVIVNLIPRQSWARPAVGHNLAGQPVSRVLGTCALYRRFGLPGPAVTRWIASSLGYYWGDPITLDLQEARHRVLKTELSRTSDWASLPWYGEVRWVEVGCLRGEGALCLRATGLDRGFDAAFPSSFYQSFPRGKLIAWLLATGTADQFGAFWRSSQPPEAALASAYGRPAGELTMVALRHWFTAPARSTPWGSARKALAGLGWVVLGLALAVVAGGRWRTET
jgi:hypothetical protein